MRKSQHTHPPGTWKPIPGYDGFFASSDGQIWSGKTNTIKTQNTSCNGKGYPTVLIWERGRDREKRVHKLVALAFHGPQPSSRHSVDHINRDRTDNRAENLRWACPVTQARNSDPYLNHLRGHWSAWLELPT
jgi:hypothetical protein